VIGSRDRRGARSARGAISSRRDQLAARSGDQLAARSVRSARGAIGPPRWARALRELPAVARGNPIRRA
jgi:hypothetical protein